METYQRAKQLFVELISASPESVIGLHSTTSGINLAAFLYISPELVFGCDPPMAGWLGVADPFEIDLRGHASAPNAPEV